MFYHHLSTCYNSQAVVSLPFFVEFCSDLLEIVNFLINIEIISARKN